MKSIKHKLILYIAIILLLVCGGLGVIAYQNAAKSLIANAEETLPVLAVEGSKIVENKLDGQLSVLEANAARERVSNVDNTWEDKKLILNNEVKRMGHLGMAIVDTNGNALSSNGATSNVADSEYFQKALSGQRAVSDPFMSEEYNALVMVYAVPIKNGDSVVGVLTATRDGKELSDITSAITYAKSGKAFMINKNCITIAHSNIELVENRDNDLENVKKDPQLQTLVELEKRMMAGETGVGEYEYNGVFKYMGFAPLESTGWSIAVAAPKDEVLAGLANMKKSSLGASLIFLILAILGVLVVARMITATLKASLNHLKLISQGDFSVTIEDKYHRIKDETGDIVRAADTLQKTMRELVGHLAEKAETLSASSQQLTSSSQQTSASAAETASAMSEMAGTVEQVNQNMQQVVSVSRLTSEHAEKGNQGLDMVNRQMETIAGSTDAVAASVSEFNDKTQQISQIVELITTIADQTNLLALNAAIEAARAGEHGRGFAVVAEEVRKLAEQSAAAADEIRSLIQTIQTDAHSIVTDIVSSGAEIKKGVQVVEEVGGSFKNIIDAVRGLSAQVDEIAAAIGQMSGGVESVAASAEEETATMEEVTASAEALSKMAEELNTIIGRYKV